MLKSMLINHITCVYRVRHGYVHISNNVYEGWREYAIGGSMNPSILSQGNLFIASGKRKVSTATLKTIKVGYGTF